MNTEIYTDGVINIGLNKGMVRLELGTLSISEKDENGKTATYYAAYCKDTKNEISKYLLSKGGKEIDFKQGEEDWNRFEDILETLQKFIDNGKIRYLGLSNETPWGVNKFLELASKKKLPRMMSVQNPYNLLNRTYEVGLAEISVREKIGLLAYSPLAIGYLTGKYMNNQIPKKSRLDHDSDFWTRYNKPNTEKAVKAYYDIAKKYNIDMAQMSLKFCEIQPFTTSVIIGATTLEQLKTNVESVNVKLNNEIIEDTFNQENDSSDYFKSVGKI